MKRIPLALLAIALLSAQPSLQAEVKLEHNFPDGRKTTANVYIKVDQVLTVAGMDIPTKSEQNLTISETNGKRQADGSLVARHKIDSLQATLNIVGMELTFDSVNPDSPGTGTPLDAVLDIFKAVAKMSWQVTYGQDNTVVSVEGKDEVFADLPAELRAATEKQFGTEYLTEETNQALRILPDGPVKKGDTWERQETVLFDSYQSMDFTTVYKYEGTIQKDGKVIDKITSKATKVTYTMADNSPGPLKIVDSELKVDESAGTILFDRAAGMVFDSKDKRRIKGSLKCEINGMELPGKLDLTFETNTNRS